jgi:hypothetical protein
MEVFVPIPMLNLPVKPTFRPNFSASKAETIPARPLPITRISVDSSSIFKKRSIVKRLGGRLLKSFGRNLSTPSETGFVTFTQRAFLILKGVEAF